MDCEKAQSLLLDELYGELDEVTSAALKRHASGCARCAADLESLRGTRKAVSIPLEEPPPDLEPRIMAAVKEAQKVVPIRSRLSHVVSRAGSWAMRPQTAMAALFLLMVGSTTFLLGGRYSNRTASAPMTVLEEGTPTPGPSPAQGAAGEQPAAVTTPPATAAASVAVHLPPAPSKEADLERQDLGALATAAPPPVAIGDAVLDEKSKGRASNAGPIALAEDVYPRNAGPIGGAAAGGSGYGGGNRGYEPRPQTQTADPFTSQEAKRDRKEGDEFSAAMSAYRGGNYSEAVRRFDVAAASGDPTAALWAARSVRASAGCGAAAARFEGAAQKLAGTPNGHDAALEAGQCRAENGDSEAARASLVPLLSVPSHKARAEVALNSLGQVAARKKAAGGSAGGLAAPKPAARAPSKAAAAEAPAAAPAPTSKAADKANAY